MEPQIVANDFRGKNRGEPDSEDAEKRDFGLSGEKEHLIVRFDSAGIYTYVSSSCKEILGYAGDDLFGKPGEELVHPKDRQKYLAKMSEGKNQAIQKNQLSYRIRHKNGDYRWLNSSLEYFHDQNGNLVTIQIESQDISELNQTKKPFHRSLKITKRLALENSVLVRIGQVISSNLKIEEVYESFAAETRKLIPFDRLAINLNEEMEKTVRVAYVSGREIAGKETGGVFPFQGSTNELLLKKRSGFFVSAKNEETLKAHSPPLLDEFQAGFCSMMSVPLFLGERFIGGFHFRCERPDAYSKKDLILAQKIANQIVGAVVNAQLFKEVERKVENLQESERRFHSLVDAVGQAGDALILLQDTDEKEGNFVFANEVAQRITGYSLKELRNLSWMDIVIPTLRDSVRDRYRRRMKGDTLSAVYEIDIKNRSGQEIPIEAVAATDILEKKATMIVFFRQITARKLAELSLIKSSQRLRELFDEAPVGYYEFDSEGTLVDMNRTALDLLGYSIEEIVGQPVWKLSLDEETTRQSILAKMAGTKPPGKNLKRIFRKKDGTTLPVLIEDRALRGATGQLIGIRSAIQDITVLSEVQETLEKSEQEAQRLAHQNRILASIGRITSSAITIEESYKQFAEEVRKILPYDRIVINLLNNDGQTSTNRYVAGDPAPQRDGGDAFPLTGTMTEKVIQTRESINLNCQDENEMAERLLGILPEFQAGFRSFLSVPLFSKDRALGGIHLRSKTWGAYSDRDVRLAESIAYQISGTIANSQLAEMRMKIEQELRESEEKFRKMSDAAKDAIILMDHRGLISFWNQEAQLLFGYSEAEALGKDLHGLIAPGPLAGNFKIAFPLFLETGQGSAVGRSVELQGIRKSGETFPVELSLSAVKIREHWNAIGILRDIGARKQEELKLKESEARFRDLFDGAPAGYLEFNSQGLLTGINKTALSMLGYSQEELLGQPIWKLSANEKVIQQSALEKMAGSKPAERFYERILQKKDGTTFSVSVEDRILKDKEGRILGMRVIIQDNTEKKLLENHLAQSQKLEAVGQLAAGIAHEINTPIQYIGDNIRFFQDAFQDLDRLLQIYEQLRQAIKGGGAAGDLLNEIEAVSKETDSTYLLQEIPKALQQTLEGVGRVANIVRAMKEFSHPGTKEKSAIDLNQALQNTITVARNEWKYVAEMEMDLNPSLPPVFCLPGEVNQVFLNIIINAAHAIADNLENLPSGKGRILIRSLYDDHWAEIQIADTGRGVPKEIQGKIFDPFFTTKTAGKGTGQGLAIAHSVIVKKHGGMIRFESEVGKGTTFFIRLPLNHQAESENIEAAANY